MHNVLSIRSVVTYGYAGNSSTTFPPQRVGVNVYPVYTVTFFDHIGCESWRGPMIAVSDTTDVVTGIDERGALADVDAVLAGYLGSADVGQAVLDAAALVKLRNPDAIFLANPVMGDVGRSSRARSGIPEFSHDHVVAAADAMTPNLFGLQYPVGYETSTLSEMTEVVREPRDRGPEIVVVTSAVATDTPDGLLRMLAVDVGQAWLVEAPILERSFTGSGDLIAAMFLTHWLHTKDLGGTLGAATSVVCSTLEQTPISGEAELQFVAAQEQVVSPVNRFTAHNL